MTFNGKSYEKVTSREVGGQSFVFYRQSVMRIKDAKGPLYLVKQTLPNGNVLFHPAARIVDKVKRPDLAWR